MPETRLNVFISSTSIDLPDHRAAVRDAILALGFHPDGMEHWPVGGEYPVTLCQQKVANADIYLGIYAHRYGWRPEGYDGKSITELEYDWAADVTRDGKPIPRLCFIMDDNFPWPKNKIELDAQAALDRFKNRVKVNHVGFFTTPDNLAKQVTAALAYYKTTTPPRFEPIVWQPGATFDEYTLRSVLGMGGNGQVWLADEHLPDGRAALFGQFVGQILAREAQTAERRGEAFPDTTLIENALVALARALQDAQTTVIAPSDAHRAILASLTGDDRHDQITVLLRAATDANILATDGDNLKFAHQLLHEYFAACILLEAMNNHESPAQFFGATWWDAGVWRETTVILGEFMGEGAHGANTVAQWLASVSPEVALQVITRNGAGLTLADVAEDTRTLLLESAHAKTAETNPLGRAAAYRVLGLFNADQRKSVSVIIRNGIQVPDLDWVEIPDDGVWTYQKGQHPPLPTFYITRYPITYAQFQCFVDAPDFNDDRWWHGMPEEQAAYGPTYGTLEIDEQWFKYANHPRESVSWYQAVAFGRWLSDKLGIEITLPTEQQWEKAARGTDGRVYPYIGDFDPAKGNTSETGIEQTSAVGIFPTGASPYGVFDMSGNVWQWCLNQYRNPETISVDDTGSNRTLRGGSWWNPQVSARAVARNYDHPASRYSIFGFRVVVERPPS